MTTSGVVTRNGSAAPPPIRKRSGEPWSCKRWPSPPSPCPLSRRKWRAPGKKGQALFPTWFTFLLVAALSGVAVWFVLQLGGNSTPAVEPYPQGDGDNRWQAYELADRPTRIPGQVEDALL